MAIYGLMKKQEKEMYTKLLVLEIDEYLSRIYKTMKRTAKLKKPKIFNKQINLMHATPTSTKTYEFNLNPVEEVKKGNIGTIIIITNGIKEPMHRKQRALFIACEFYVYHAFANHPDERYFNEIKGQNQYLDMIRKVFRKKSSHELRDHAVRYVIEEIGEHKLAHMSGDGWYTRIGKLKDHNHIVEDLLGTSEKTFKSIIKKQHQIVTPDMLKSEEHLIKKEKDDIQFLIDYLETITERHPDSKLKHHIKNLCEYTKKLDKIQQNLDKWYLADKQEHKLLKKGLLRRENIHSMLDAEAEADMIDINKVYILFHHFEKEKINILKDIELITGKHA